MQISLRDISSYIFNKPSKILEEINTNALMEQWLVKYPSPKQFVNRYDMYEYVNDKYCGGGGRFP